MRRCALCTFFIKKVKPVVVHCPLIGPPNVSTPYRRIAEGGGGRQLEGIGPLTEGAAKDRMFALLIFCPVPASRKRPKNQPDQTDVFRKDPQKLTEVALYFKLPTAAGVF